MNVGGSNTAADILNSYGAHELSALLYKYAELPFSGKLASLIVMKRASAKFRTVADLLEIVDRFTSPNRKYGVYSRVFQALRIEVNKEMEALEEMLVQALKTLKQGGRLVVISYHSIEDRLVKNFFRSGRIDGVIEKDFYGNQTKYFQILTPRPMTPSPEEIESNPRSRSAKLRAAIKL